MVYDHNQFLIHSFAREYSSRSLSHTQDSLAESDKIILEVAKILREDFLQQNGFTDYDRFCPFYKTSGMLKNIILFYNLCQRAVESTAQSDNKITLAIIKTRLNDLIYKITSMKFELPSEGQEVVEAHFAELREEIEQAFRQLEEAHSRV